MARNLINIESVSKAFDIRPLLSDVSLGISEGERIGVVGRNGGGKSTLLKVLAGMEPPDNGRVTQANWARIGVLHQVDNAPMNATVRDVVVGSKKVHEWASDAGVREIFTGLFGGISGEILDRPYRSLSGGERRRVGIAKLLIDPLDLVLLDEPTNHLDLWACEALEEALLGFEGTVIVVSHDRWFLDRVCTHILAFEGEGQGYWFEGGFSDYEENRKQRLGITDDTPKKFKYKKLVAG